MLVPKDASCADPAKTCAGVTEARATQILCTRCEATPSLCVATVDPPEPVSEPVPETTCSEVCARSVGAIVRRAALGVMRALYEYFPLQVKTFRSLVAPRRGRQNDVSNGRDSAAQTGYRRVLSRVDTRVESIWQRVQTNPTMRASAVRASAKWRRLTQPSRRRVNSAHRTSAASDVTARCALG